MPHYLDLTWDDQYLILKISGQVCRVERSRLGNHLRLSHLLVLIQQAIQKPDGTKAAHLVKRYLLLAGVPENLVNQTPGAPLLQAFVLVSEFNSIQVELPWMRTDIPHKRERTVFEPGYDGREWALWIHRLATRYGWTRDYIFNLWPEEAAIYLTEVYLSEWEEMEADRRLSEVSYKYDRFTKTARFIELEKPYWMMPQQRPEITQAESQAWEMAKKTSGPNQMLPAGVVLDWRAVLAKQKGQEH